MFSLAIDPPKATIQSVSPQTCFPAEKQPVQHENTMCATVKTSYMLYAHPSHHGNPNIMGVCVYIYIYTLFIISDHIPVHTYTYYVCIYIVYIYIYTIVFMG